MREWAEISKSKVLATHEMPDDLVPEFNPNSFRYAVEITDANPKPQQGWGYDLETDTFSPPTPVQKVEITPEELWDRLSDTEKEKIATSTDPKIATYRFDVFSVRKMVTLNDSKLINALNYLETNNFLDNVGRASEILTIEEV